MEKEGWLSSRNKTKHNPKQRILRRQTSLPKKRVRSLGDFLLTQSPPPEELFKATKQSHMEQFFKPNTPIKTGTGEKAEDVRKEALVDETGDAALELIDESETDINGDTEDGGNDCRSNKISKHDEEGMKNKIAKFKEVRVSSGFNCKRKFYNIDAPSDGYENKYGGFDNGTESTGFVSEALYCDEIVANTKRRKMCESVSEHLYGYSFNNICIHKGENKDYGNATTRNRSKEEKKNKDTAAGTELTSLEHNVDGHSVSNQMDSFKPPTDTFTLEDSSDVAEENVDTERDSVIKEHTYQPSYLTETYNSQDEPDSETNRNFTFSDMSTIHQSDSLDNIDVSTVEHQTCGLQTSRSSSSQISQFSDTDHDIHVSLAETETLVDIPVEEDSDDRVLENSSLQLESQCSDTDHDIHVSFAETETLVDIPVEEDSDDRVLENSSLQLESQCSDTDHDIHVSLAETETLVDIRVEEDSDDRVLENSSLQLESQCSDTDHDIHVSLAETETLVDIRVEEDSDERVLENSSLHLESQFSDTDHDIHVSLAETETLVDIQVEEDSDDRVLGNSSLQLESQFTFRSQREFYDALEHKLAIEELEESSQGLEDLSNSSDNVDNDIDNYGEYSQEFR